MYRRGFLFGLIFFYSSLHAQVINNTYTYRDIAASRYVRYNYENDFFTATDELYTQGIQLEYAAPALQKLPTSKLLISPKTTCSNTK